MLILRGWFLTRLVARWQRWQVGRFSSRHRGSRGSGRVCWLRACPIDEGDQGSRVSFRFVAQQVQRAWLLTYLSFIGPARWWADPRTIYSFGFLPGRQVWGWLAWFVVRRSKRRGSDDDDDDVVVSAEGTINFTVHRSQRSGYWEGTNSTRWLQLLTFLLLLTVLKVKFSIRSTVDVLWFRLLILWV